MSLRRLLLPTVLVGLLGVGLLGVGLLGGCGGSAGPELAPAQGTVTLNGQPLAGARVTFVSQQEGGSVGVGTTDAEGHYEISFTAKRMGAMVGPTLVRISKMVRDPSPRGRAEQEEVEVEAGDDAAGNEDGVPMIDLVPPQYNVRSELTIEVRADNGTYNFDL